MTITPRQFVDTWARSELREQQGAQNHFIMLCDLVNYLNPAQLDPEGIFFTFEEKVEKATGGQGRADVWYKDHFAWEYKGKHKDLDEAYWQLLAYRGGLGNPPLLVVCDFLEYRIYPQWPNASAQPFKFYNEDLLKPETRRFITWLLESPEKFLELRQSELEQRERLTRELAEHFAELARLMRDHKDATGNTVWKPMQIARFLAKVTFALFAEDIDLMPRPFKQPVFRVLVDGARQAQNEFVPYLESLFKAMDGQNPFFMLQPVPYFNGGLFADSSPGAGDGTEALDLTEIFGGLDTLGKASEADWRYVNPSIFGTLFEGALDESKRAQLGAHYTSEADIRLIIEPVLMEPLNRLWQAVQVEAEPLMQTYLIAETPKATQQARERLVQLHDQMMTTIEQTRVLDPACGSGNFLYVALRALKDLEGKVRKTFEPLGLPFRDVVTPRQLYGIEKDEFAAKLAQIVIWIGYLQWRYEDEGMLHPYKKTSSPHPRQLPNPILQDKYSPDEPDHIQCNDAILRYRADGTFYEPDWPKADVIVGNPPFLGGNRIRQELGDTYVDDLFRLYEGRVPAFADLVCYWFENARTNVEQGRARRVGLLATNSIRGGVNRTVLERIKQTGDIFMAWSDRPWILEGAAVRISMIGFDNGSQASRVLNGQTVAHITANLEGLVDLTQAATLAENAHSSFMGPSPKAEFDIDEPIAKTFLASQNASGKSNSDVVRPVISAVDIVKRSRKKWTIDFGLMSLKEAQEYEAPFQYLEKHVYPVRSQNRRVAYAQKWWQYAEPRPGMRKALAGKERFIATAIHAKHRIFVWVKAQFLCNQATIVFARDDDYFFGVLHAYPHEIWALRLGTSLEDRPRYTPTTTFETFPLPYTPGKEPTNDPTYLAISEAAKQLNEEREAWLNPPRLINLFAEPDMQALQELTLTNLYNALESYRTRKANGGKALHDGSEAAKFAPRLAELHRALDQAVLYAYGWDDLVENLRTTEGDEELLRRLLQLNQVRSASS